MWVWQKQFAEPTQNKMDTITALAVDPEGKKVACHGHSTSYADEGVHYLFVLDTRTGGIVSGMRALTFGQPYIIKNSGFLLKSNGNIVMVVGTPA